MIRFRVFTVFLVVALTACGGGGGSGQGTAPSISNLAYTPTSAFLNDGGGSITIHATLDFQDPDGDLAAYHLVVTDPQSNVIQSLDGAISADGLTSGQLFASLSVGTSGPGVFHFRFTVEDAAGHTSSALSGDFPIRDRLQLTSTLPDTGVTRCFGASSLINCPEQGQAFHGQDFMYSANPMSLSDQGDGTVGDSVTGLVWQQTPDLAAYNWYQASGTAEATHNPADTDVCGALTLGGHSDWRLPSRSELVSTFNYGSLSAVDPTLFDSPALDEYWVAEQSATTAFYADSRGAILSAAKEQVHHVRCVRGAVWGTGTYIDNGNGTVTDPVAALTWQATGQTGYDWQGMLAFCEALELGGSPDWRLPNIKELETLIDAGSGISMEDGLYCSSTTDAGDYANVWMVQFHPTANPGELFPHGAGYGKTNCSIFYFRCVH